tara:strand:+ start:831 stop:1790 length:960 start_codon:yes stop_codon:yes gene_type:complete
MNEFDLIKKYFLKLSKKNKSALNLNDDVFFDKLKKTVISIDTYVEGIHFIDFKKPELVIKKVLRSSISDLICKGVKPNFYFISGSGNKKSFSKTNLKKITKSLNQEQKKYNIFLGGGDTVYSDKLSFTITSIGFSNDIIHRNNAKFNDDIYVTGNLGDSFIGLRVLKKKIKISRNLKKYFEQKYFQPTLNLDLIKKLKSFANTSIDISDGLITDLEKLINKQKLSFKIYMNLVPISKKLKYLIDSKKISKEFCVSKGDDYQILFTADPKNSRIIKKTSKSLGIKISKIGKISSPSVDSEIIDQKGKKINLKNKGYSHKF